MFILYVACVWVHVHGHGRRHLLSIRPNATWQFWITLLAIQGYSPHHRYTNMRKSSSLCSWNPWSSFRSWIKKPVWLNTTPALWPGLSQSPTWIFAPLLLHCSPLRNVCAVKHLGVHQAMLKWPLFESISHYFAVYASCGWCLSMKKINEQPWGLR